MIPDYLVGVIATIVTFCLGAVVSLAIAWFRDKEAGKRLRVQLYYEDRRRAAQTLHKLVGSKYESFVEFKRVIVGFLKGFESQFLPDEFRSKLLGYISDMDRSIVKWFPQEQISDEEIERWADDYAEYLASLSPDERAEVDIKQRFDSMRRRITEDIESLVRQLGQ